MLYIILVHGFCPLKIKTTQFPDGFRLISLRWPIYLKNSVDKSKYLNFKRVLDIIRIKIRHLNYKNTNGKGLEDSIEKISWKLGGSKQ